jgi:hypothetical protein
MLTLMETAYKNWDELFMILWTAEKNWHHYVTFQVYEHVNEYNQRYKK